ncbi:hypothetical protein M406DRAFT_75444 [Cryphonectria parasitica EP155]|uniref:Uncharacterized protein n=1 Tax=Cryphonectria parasitica (strain ATCC 38755 / EP155) TaxID=660469 RepID=A0A9P4XSI6_CRYP1|nr:uncharacterized protein M406DRAFT_75444 [Cryphonectria parasitica EP155]KAF3760088.1 hypothetical protein M406DRAFT_75444 [Cryphonectria parasitica EP155]
MILLALLFVYRLKMIDPSIRGQPGSEYRLLTVALILANKFLDDNAYTNKTWAEVSSISVQDIRVMKFEFLSYMQYAVLTSMEQWEEWLDRLALYYAICEQVSHGSSSLSRIVPSPTLLIPSSAIAKGVSLVFSPTADSPAIYQSAQNGFARTNSGRVHARCTVPANSIPMRYLETVSRVPISLSQRSDSGGLNDRKRKRADQVTSDANYIRKYKHLYAAVATTGSSLCSITSSAETRISSHVNGLRASHNYLLSSCVEDDKQRCYTAGSMRQLKGNSRTHTGFASFKGSYPTTQYPPKAHYPTTSNATFTRPTKQLSLVTTLIPAAAYNASSPLHDYPYNSSFHTPITHFSFICLQQQDSPYKRMRHVRTRRNLYPPLSLQSYPQPATPPNQIHYQPIGCRNDLQISIALEHRV